METIQRFSIDEDELSTEKGFRNFTSFVAINYYQNKLSLKGCAELLGVSPTKIKTSILKRGFNLRSRGLRPGVAPKKKRSINFTARVREHTPYLFPWCALYVYYDKFKLTTYEISDIIKVSQPVILRYLRKYKIKVRHSGAKINNVNVEKEIKKNGSKNA